MKKIISIIFMIIILVVTTTNVNATDEQAKNIELNVSGQTTIESDVKTVDLTVSLGNFTGISENIVLGYQTTLEYDTNMFESVAVEGLNGWTATYSPDTNILIGDTQNARANTNITKITLTLKDGVEAGTSGTINLRNIELTDETNDFTYNRTITVRIEEESNPGDNTNTIQDNTTNTNEQNQTGNSVINNNVSATNTSNSASSLNRTNSSNVDNTTATKVIPKAGMTNILIIGICVVIVAGIIFKIKSRKIKY